MTITQMPTRRPDVDQRQLLAYMEAGATPTMAVGLPGAKISLGPWDANWQITHDAPPDVSILAGLVNRGIVQRLTERHGLRTVYRWVLVQT